jgi:hypothetical protein
VLPLLPLLENIIEQPKELLHHSILPGKFWCRVSQKG